MKKDTNIIVRTDNVTKKSFQAVAKKYGFSTSEVIYAFMTDIAKRGKIPLNLIAKVNYFRPKQDIDIAHIKKCLTEAIKSNSLDVKISKAYIFGSYARGEENETSDVDIRLVTNDNFDLFDLGNLHLDLEEKLGLKVDLITSNSINKEFYQNIKKDEICIYEC